MGILYDYLLAIKLNHANSNIEYQHFSRNTIIRLNLRNDVFAVSYDSSVPKYLEISIQ